MLNTSPFFRFNLFSIYFVLFYLLLEIKTSPILPSISSILTVSFSIVCSGKNALAVTNPFSKYNLFILFAMVSKSKKVKFF